MPLRTFLGYERQKGQAFVYGILVLVGGLAALFFLFNAGQLSNEKTKLVNTADAVAYSAGVMHARALNFDAYTNRALIANEVTIAQLVSLSSWAQYAEAHEDAVPPLNCYDPPSSLPHLLGLRKYAPLCHALTLDGMGVHAVPYARKEVDLIAPRAVKEAELAKKLLQKAQATMAATFGPARAAVMREVAKQNYLDDGEVQVDAEPLRDEFTDYGGEPFIRAYQGEDRKRFRSVELEAANKDQFVNDRAWDDHSLWDCNLVFPRGDVYRTGETTLVGFDEWKAADQAFLHVEQEFLHFPWFGAPYISCDTVADYSLGEGSQSAKIKSAAGLASSKDWDYSGVPSHYELSGKALASGDPRMKFAIRLTRKKTAAATSAGRSQVKPKGSLDLYQGAEAADSMAAVSTSEVYFERPAARADRREEIGSLFNPYWQVRLIATSDSDLGTAKSRQTRP